MNSPSRRAEIGEHSVRITTLQAANPDSDPPQPGVPEKIPVNYNSNTELTADVKAGKNNIDFPLSSERTALRSQERR